MTSVPENGKSTTIFNLLTAVLCIAGINSEEILLHMHGTDRHPWDFPVSSEVLLRELMFCVTIAVTERGRFLKKLRKNTKD